MAEGLSWEKVTWRKGDDVFVFDIERGGVFATLVAPGDRSLTLPMVVWEGLIEALKANKSTRARSEQQFPARSRSRWYEGEALELAVAYKAGKTIAQLARMHNRTEYAIEGQLDRLGLISTGAIYGADRRQDVARQNDVARMPAREPGDGDVA